jgi:hypothetical protein
MAGHVEFNFGTLPVGYFKDEVPTAEGRVRYEPYRGPGHYQMGIALREGKHPRCSYEAGGSIVNFDVIGRPEFGVLELGNFLTF